MNPKSIDSRKSFEEWMKEQHGNFSLASYSFNKSPLQYMNELTIIAWEAWQASEKRLTRKKR